MIKTTVSYTVNTKKDVRALFGDLEALAQKRVLVGVPQDEDPREKGEGIGNAMLAYIHDNGSPAQGIPARPFMQPGIKKAKNKINQELKLAAQKFMLGNEEEGTVHLERAGFHAVSSIRKVIEKGIGFTPLKRATLLGRLRRRKSLHAYFKNKPWRNDEKFELLQSFKPLIDTGEMMKSITYVVEGQEDRQK